MIPKRHNNAAFVLVVEKKEGATFYGPFATERKAQRFSKDLETSGVIRMLLAPLNREIGNEKTGYMSFTLSWRIQ